MDQFSNEVKISKNSSIAIGSEDTVNEIVASDPKRASNLIVESIRKILLDTKSFSSVISNIYKVPKNLRNVNSKAYIPQVISIGPFHYGKEDLKAMEVHKHIYLQSFINRAGLKLENVVEEVERREEKARHCYAEPINMNREKFVKLMIVDGCFLVEYCIRRHKPDYQGQIDHLFRGRLSDDLFSDLIKLENQIPFFVLESLFDLYQSGSEPLVDVQSLYDLFRTMVDHNYNHGSKEERCSPDHFVHLLWICFAYDPYFFFRGVDRVDNKKKIQQPPTATELYEAGIKFQPTVKEGSGDVIRSITFKNGVLEIPHIEIFSDYETYLRNLIAYEQCYQPAKYYVSFFALFMDGLINTDKDVSLLIKGKIITNYLGSNEDVSKLFNNICKHINVHGKNHFNEVCHEMRKYCQARRHRWMASLRRNYFNSPWAYISFVGAAVLLILTFIQTIFSIRK